MTVQFAPLNFTRGSILSGTVLGPLGSLVRDRCMRSQARKLRGGNGEQRGTELGDKVIGAQWVGLRAGDKQLKWSIASPEVVWVVLPPVSPAWK